jgi:hypothetical protein
LAAGRVSDGHNLLPHFEVKGPSPRQEYLSDLGPKLEGVRQGPWKYHQQGEAEGEAFHRQRDPGERYNLRAPEPQAAGRLASRMADARAKIDGDSRGPQPLRPFVMSA